MVYDDFDGGELVGPLGSIVNEDNVGVGAKWEDCVVVVHSLGSCVADALRRRTSCIC